MSLHVQYVQFWRPAPWSLRWRPSLHRLGPCDWPPRTEAGAGCCGVARRGCLAETERNKGKLQTKCLSHIAQSVEKNLEKELAICESAFHCELQSCPRGQIFMFAWGADGPCAAYSTSWTSWTSLLERLGSLSLQRSHTTDSHQRRSQRSVQCQRATCFGWWQRCSTAFWDQRETV